MEKGGSVLDQKYGTHLCEIGGGMKDGKALRFALSFQLKNQLSKNEIRKLLIDMQEDFYQYLLSYSNIQPYLISQPFPKDQIYLVIFLRSGKGTDLFYPHISVGSIGNSILAFHYDDPEKPIGPYKLVEEEPYEEALNTLQ